MKTQINMFSFPLKKSAFSFIVPVHCHPPPPAAQLPPLRCPLDKVAALISTHHHLQVRTSIPSHQAAIEQDLDPGQPQRLVFGPELPVPILLPDALEHESPVKVLGVDHDLVATHVDRVVGVPRGLARLPLFLGQIVVQFALLEDEPTGFPRVAVQVLGWGGQEGSDK